MRAVRRLVDFSFVRRDVAGLYGDRGNESIDPIVLLKLLFLKFFYEVKSTREMMRELPMHLEVRTTVADKQYGTASNYRMLHESNVTPCIPHKRVREDPTKFERQW